MSNDKLEHFNPLAGEAASALPPFEMDPAEYMDDLAEFDMTEAQKLELLQTLWSIMGACVELGFTTNICEQIFESAGLTDSDSADGVNSGDNTKGGEASARRAEREQR